MKYISVTTALSPFNDFSNVPADRLTFAAERGTYLHKCFAGYARTGVYPFFMPEDFQPYFDSFKRWFDEYVKTVVMVEKHLKDDLLGLDGHVDIVAVLKHGKTTVIDYKTPQVESKTWSAQIAAYCHLADVDAGMALILNKDGKEAKGITYNIKHHWPIFLNAFIAYRNLK